MRGALVAGALLVSSLAHAGAWTRDAGHFYLNTSYAHLSATKLYDFDFQVRPIAPYEQHVVGVFGEIGIVSRWLTASVEGQLYRRAELTGQGATEGVGDWRVGAWTGLVDKPFRLSFGLILGVPTGDASPSAPPGRAELTARSLPTGDGEWDVEARLAFGYSFTGRRRWPVRHYFIAEAGYWFRTRGFADVFTYKLEMGTQFPYRFIDRFWFIWRLAGIESFASNQEAARDATGLGDGVTYLSPGVDLYGRIWRGLGASVGVDGALRGRAVADAVQVRSAISYQW